MSNVLRLAIVDPDDSSRESLKSTLLGLDTIWLDAECSRYAFFRDVLEQTSPDVGVVSLDGDPDKAIALIEELSKSHPEVSLLAASGSNDGNMILRTMRAGAKEFLTQPVRPEDLATALQRIGRSRPGGLAGGAHGCRVIALSGCTGGVGVTSLAVNLGCALAELKARGEIRDTEAGWVIAPLAATTIRFASESPLVASDGPYGA